MVSLFLNILSGFIAHDSPHWMKIVVPSIIFLLLVLPAAWFLIYGGGRLLYRLLVFPRKKMRGLLLCRKRGQEAGEGEPPQKFELGQVKREYAVLSFQPGNKKADFYVQGSAYDHALIIRNAGSSSQPPYLQGWGALWQGPRPVMTMVQCTVPGIIECGGEVLTHKELFHADEFVSGEFTFQYLNTRGRWFPVNNTGGKNILEGRV